MAKQTFTAGQVLTAAEMNSLQENDYNWTVTTKTASYTLAAGDEGTRIVMNNAGATTITVDDAVFSAGDVVWIHNIGAGTCTITAGTATVSTLGELALEQYAGGHLYFTSASAAIFFPTEQGGGGKILQVVSTTKTDTFTTTSASYTDITGMSVTITPSATSNKVLVIVSLQANGDPGVEGGFIQLVRDSTAICIGDSAGSRTQASAFAANSVSLSIPSNSIHYLDSPNTTSATTYKLQGYTYSTNTFYVNRADSDNDIAERARTASSITVMEVSA